MSALFLRVMRRLVPGCDSGDEQARARAGRLEGWVSIAANTLLAAVKGALALISGSVALATDAVHTLADSLTSLVVILGFRWSAKPADEQHPFGHAKIESVATLVIGVLLAVAAVELGRVGVAQLLRPTPVSAPLWIIIVVAATALAKELLARFSFALGKLIDSDTLAADGWHHRSDVLATLLVVVAFVGARFGLEWIDGAASIAVALIIGWAAAEIIKQAAQPLIGQAPPAELIEAVSRIARGVDGVRGVHDIVAIRHGRRVVVSLHAVVPAELTLLEAHEICNAVEAALAEQLGAHATVHADPLPPPHPQREAIAQLLEQELESLEHCSGAHHLWVEEGPDERLHVSVEISTSAELTPDQLREHRRKLQELLQEQYAGAALAVHFDPPYCADDGAGATADRAND